MKKYVIGATIVLYIMIGYGYWRSDYTKPRYSEDCWCLVYDFAPIKMLYIVAWPIKIGQ